MRTIKEDMTGQLVDELAQHLASLVKLGDLDPNNADDIVHACDAFMNNNGFAQRKTDIDARDRAHAEFLMKYALHFYGNDH